MVMAPTPPARVLVKLSDVTQELTVGIGNASATVRTLTNVSLEIHERELVVLSGSRGAGERAMLSVIAGDRRGVTGSCEIAPHTRVRLMRIAARAALALTQEWQRAEMLAYYASAPNPSQQGASQQVSDIFLLDVVADEDESLQSEPARRVGTRRVAETRVIAPRPWNEQNRAALMAWAGVCRMRGGAVVMAASEAVGSGIFDTALTNTYQTTSERPTPTSAVREVRFESSTVRVVPMHSGRLASSVRLRSRDLAS